TSRYMRQLLYRLSRRDSFFFQAEDGIRDWSVTGVQTCALPIWLTRLSVPLPVEAHTISVRLLGRDALMLDDSSTTIAPGGPPREIGRASCRERVGERGRGWSREQIEPVTERQCVCGGRTHNAGT